jgi:hypothetical protein
VANTVTVNTQNIQVIIKNDFEILFDRIQGMANILWIHRKQNISDKNAIVKL